MAPYREKLTTALERVKGSTRTAQANIVRSEDLRRGDRELLTAAGWLQPILRGWYMLVRPDGELGDSTPWFAHYWSFVSLYLSHNFQNSYCLSAEFSLLLHTRATTIPEQLVVMVARGGGQSIQLPHGTSLYPYREKLPAERVRIDDILCMPLAMALCRISARFFRTSPDEAELALGLLTDPEELVQFGHERGAGRVVGALDAMGNGVMAVRIRAAFRDHGLSLREENPFEEEVIVPEVAPRSPFAQRVEILWAKLRQQVLDLFPERGQLPNPADYFSQVDTLYSQDAYHSLSIEGYRVTPELIDQVRGDRWDPEHNPADLESRNALAARGYFEAFEEVKRSIAALFAGCNPGEQLKADLQTWFQALWNPSRQAGMLKAHHLMGYRRGPVYIRGSRHLPPSAETLLDAMEALFDCLRREPHASVRAILGHYLFVFIHPYPDGNGRIARFLMNAMFASGGYPWTVIRVEHRAHYIESLEKVNLEGDIRPFTKLVMREMGV